MTDEELLEKVALRIGLVDHEKAQSVGGKEAEEADVKLAEEGYEEKWEFLWNFVGVWGWERWSWVRRGGGVGLRLGLFVARREAIGRKILF